MITAAQIKFIRSLAQKKVRSENKLFVAEGSKLICDLLRTSLRVHAIYALADADLSTASFESVSRKDIERMTNLKTASDAIALFEIPAAAPLAFDGLTLVLDGVQDPGNIGTIIRIADWFGIKRILCSENCADAFAPKVVQASMGSIARVELFYTDLVEALISARKDGVPIFGTFLEGRNIYKESLPSSGVIVMGSEGRGISEPVAALVTDKLLIPPFDAAGCQCESLNVAVATAVICSEFRR